LYDHVDYFVVNVSSPIRPIWEHYKTKSRWHIANAAKQEFG
jgi:hypothetical protein